MNKIRKEYEKLTGNTAIFQYNTVGPGHQFNPEYVRWLEMGLAITRSLLAEKKVGK